MVESMKKYSDYLILLAVHKNSLIGSVQIISIIAVVAAAIVYSKAPQADEPKPPRVSIREDIVPLVSIIKPQSRTAFINVDATGSVVVRNYVSLTTQVTGRIDEISPALRDGGIFTAHQILLKIESTDFELALAQADADVASAEANLLLQKAQSDAARANYQLVHPTEAKVPTLVARVPQIKQAEAALASAIARQNVAKIELSRTRFSLPFDGRVVASSAEVGQVLNRAVSFGQAFGLEAVEVAVPLTPQQLRMLTPIMGRQARVRTNGIEVSATVERVASELDAKSRFAKVYLSLVAENQLPPGTFLEVTFAGPEIPATFELPTGTVQLDGKVWYAAEGELRSHQLKIFGRTDNGLIVDSFDYASGIVLGNVPGGQDGLKVRITQAEKNQVLQKELVVVSATNSRQTTKATGSFE